jgi:hypothetical protein
MSRYGRADEKPKDRNVMMAQAFHVDDHSGRDDLKLAQRSSFASGTTRYRLDVVAPDVGDVIQSAGGWLFDRAMAGWDVNVLVTDECDARPLQILGARTLGFDSAIESIDKGQSSHALAVAVETFRMQARIRETVVAALDRGVEVTLWGDKWPPELDHRVDAVQHRLSSAARAFKAHALAAASLAHDAVRPTERYRSRGRWYSPNESDLLSAGCRLD